ncbi:MAG: (Fe-S)-binding protein, partial [Desulfobacteraceae bacterium]|nr:(Fe-S)-binding protein [Desulfobacteraceae bacterium]
MTENEKIDADVQSNEIIEEKETAEPLDTETITRDAVRKIPIHKLDIKRLIELDACTRCGECLSWCPVYDQDSKEELVPRRKIIDFLRIARSQNGFLAKIMESEKVGESLKKIIGRVCGYKEVTKEQMDEFVSNLYECSTCGQCEVVCPAHI